MRYLQRIEWAAVTEMHNIVYLLYTWLSCLEFQIFRRRKKYEAVVLVAEQRHSDIENAFKIIGSFKLVCVDSFDSRIKQHKTKQKYRATNANVDPLKDELYTAIYWRTKKWHSNFWTVVIKFMSQCVISINVGNIWEYGSDKTCAIGTVQIWF